MVILGVDQGPYKRNTRYLIVLKIRRCSKKDEDVSEGYGNQVAKLGTTLASIQMRRNLFLTVED